MTEPTRELSIEDSYHTAAKYAQFALQQMDMVFENLQRALQAASIDSGRWETWKSFIELHHKIENTPSSSSPEHRKLVRAYEKWLSFPSSYVEHELMSAIHVFMNNRWMLRQGPELLHDPATLYDWRLRNDIPTEADKEN